MTKPKVKKRVVLGEGYAWFFGQDTSINLCEKKECGRLDKWHELKEAEKLDGKKIRLIAEVLE